jgi:rod shape-determining protein MreD
MSLLIAAVGAVLASLLETSVLPELHASLDLVLVFALVSAMLLSVEEGLIWAFLGGLTLDLLNPGSRALGSTALCLLLATGGGLVIARITQPPRVLTVVVTVLALTFLYHALLAVVLAATEGVSLAGFSFAAAAVTALLNAILAAVAGRLIHGLSMRFSPAEHSLR